MHTHTSSSALVFTRRWVENINWRQSAPRLRGLEEGLGSESWLSSQEVLFLTTLHKHWKRDPKKMSQTHYFHCKQADIHIFYCSLSLFLSYSMCRSSSSARRLYVLPKEHPQNQALTSASAFKWRHVIFCKVLTVYANTNNSKLETKTLFSQYFTFNFDTESNFQASCEVSFFHIQSFLLRRRCH